MFVATPTFTRYTNIYEREATVFCPFQRKNYKKIRADKIDSYYKVTNKQLFSSRFTVFTDGWVSRYACCYYYIMINEKSQS